MKLNFVANENYLLVKVGRNTKNDTKKDDINAKVATRSQLVTSQCGKQPVRVMRSPANQALVRKCTKVSARFYLKNSLLQSNVGILQICIGSIHLQSTLYTKNKYCWTVYR